MEGMEPTVDAPPAPKGQARHADILRRMIVARPAETPAADDLLLMPDFIPEPPAAMGIDRVAAVALGRTADRLYGLPTFVESVTCDPATPAELAELFPERALLAVVQGEGDRLGVVALCPSLIASLIEMQAIGRVSSRAVRARKPTRTDASITADFVNRLLCELGNAAAPDPEQPDFAGFRYASFLDDARPLLLMLEDAPLANLVLTFRIGSGGQRDGKILVALPSGAGSPDFAAPPPAFAMIAQESPAPETETFAAFDPAEDEGDDPDSLVQAVRSAPIPLHGVLCRRMMSLRAIRALKAGDLIALPSGALNETRLETGSGQLLVKGRLGEADGLHAIRLHGQEGETASGGLSRAYASAAGSHLPDIDTQEPDQFRNPFDEAIDMPADRFAAPDEEASPLSDAEPVTGFAADFDADFASDFASDFDTDSNPDFTFASKEGDTPPTEDAPFELGALPTFG